MSTAFISNDDVASLVEKFEACTIHPEEFKHYQHLAVALWYVANFPPEAAIEKMRSGIKKLATAYGKSGYHETITLFWLAVVRDFFERAAGESSIAELANRLAREYDKSLIRDYFSDELLASEAAKQGWVEPDLKPLVSIVPI